LENTQYTKEQKFKRKKWEIIKGRAL